MIIWSQGLRAQEKAEVTRLVEGIIGAPLLINPLLSPLNSPDQDLVSLIFSGLTRLSASGEPIPDLAQSWEISEDGRTYVFYLRPQARWHDGHPFSAEDVVFTYSLLAHPNFPGDPTLASIFQEVQCRATDELTVECELPEPFSPFLAYTTVGILPSHLLAPLPPEALPHLPFNRQPIGTGPFRLMALEENRALLARNREYYMGPPQIQLLELRFFSDLHSALTALHRGELNGLLVGQNIEPQELEGISSSGQFRLLDATRTPYTALFFNTSSPLLAEPQMRRVLALLIDRQTIVQTVLAGRAVPGLTPIPPGSWAHNTLLKPQPPQQEEASRLLTEMGWQRPRDGLWEKGSQPLSFQLVTDSDPVRAAVAEEVARQLRRAGIGIEIRVVTTQELVESYLASRRYDLAIFTVDTGPDPDPYPVWHSTQLGPRGANFTGYFSPEVDRLLEEARRTADRWRRRSLYSTFQIKFLEDSPAMILFYPLYTYIIDVRVKGPSPGLLYYASERFANVWEWKIEEEALPLRPDASKIR